MVNHCVLPTEYAYDLPFSFGHTGCWHDPEELRDLLCYVAVTDDGRRLLLTPEEFEEQFDWRNDPNQVLLTPTATDAAGGSTPEAE